MQTTERLRPVSLPDESRATWLIWLGLTISAMFAFDVALVTMPELSRGVLDLFGRLTPAAGGGFVSSAARVGIAVGGVALGLCVLVGFVRGVQRAPYAFLAPVLVGFASVVMARIPAELGLPVSLPSYVFAAALLLVGGGALVQLGRGVHTFVGTLVIALPLGLLVVSQLPAQAARAASLSADTKLLFFVLAAATLGVLLVALITPSVGAVLGRAQLLREHKRKLAIAMQRVSHSEQRAAFAEQQVIAAQHSLRIQGQELEAALAVQDDAAAMHGLHRGALRKWLLPATVALFVGVTSAAYFGVHAPLAARMQAQSAQLSTLATQHASELQQLRTTTGAEHQRLSAELEQARSQAQAAAATVASAQAESASLQTKLSALELAAATPAAAPARASHKRKKLPSARVAGKAVAAKSTAASTTRAATTRRDPGVDASDDPIAGLDGI